MPNFYGNPYQYPQNYYQQQQAQAVQAQAQMQNMQQNSGFMPAPNEAFAMNYPVAPGNCMTFKIEGKPIVVEKSMGFSQLESPKVDVYRLVKEEPVVETSDSPQIKVFDDGPIWNAIDDLKGEIEAVRSDIEGVKSDCKQESLPKRTTRRKDDGDD